MLTPWGICETSLGFLEPFTGGGWKTLNEQTDIAVCIKVAS